MSEMTAIIGDVGGQAEAFERLLSDMGLDVDGGRIPEGMTVVQVGDLVHRGPDSAGVLDIVDRFIADPCWVQLIGNHEAQYLNPDGPAFEWSAGDMLGPDQVELLTSWWEAGLMQVAHATPPGPDGVEVLATHAGLTLGLSRALGLDLSSAAVAAEGLNDCPRRSGDPLWWPGLMLNGGGPNPIAGPLWAESAGEVAEPWYLAGANHPPAFHQVVGHSTPVWWERNQWQAARVIMRGRAKILPGVRHVIMSTNDSPYRYVAAVDPGHKLRPSPVWSPFVVAHPRESRQR